MKMCVLYDRECIDCGECDQCELDPTKRCNNCMKCVSGDAEYRAILIDEVVKPAQEPKRKPQKYSEQTFHFILAKRLFACYNMNSE